MLVTLKSFFMASGYCKSNELRSMFASPMGQAFERNPSDTRAQGPLPAPSPAASTTTGRLCCPPHASGQDLGPWPASRNRLGYWSGVARTSRVRAAREVVQRVAPTSMEAFGLGRRTCWPGVRISSGNEGGQRHCRRNPTLRCRTSRSRVASAACGGFADVAAGQDLARPTAQVGVSIALNRYDDSLRCTGQIEKSRR